MTEIYDYLRILFARLGQPHCPECDIPIGTQTADEIVDKLLAEPAGTKLYLMAPVEVAGRRAVRNAVGRAPRRRATCACGSTARRTRSTSRRTIDRRRKHAVEVVIDRIVVRPDARSRIAGSVENALALGKGVVHVAHPTTTCPSRSWPVRDPQPALRLRQVRPQLRAAHAAQFLVQQLARLVPGVRRTGHADRREPGGAAARSEADARRRGAAASGPTSSLPMFAADARGAVGRDTGVPLDVPFDELVAAAAADRCCTAPARSGSTSTAESSRNARKPRRATRPLFRFQYKGLYPALEEASQLSPRLRGKLEHLVDEVECSTCGGSRLRDDAAAVRFRDRTIDEICRMPLGELLARVQELEARRRTRRKIAGELIREIDNRLQFLVDVGLDYLTLGRPAPDALRRRSPAHSPGQPGRQRPVRRAVRARRADDRPAPARQLAGCSTALQKLRDLGNTLLVVEHDREVIASADQLLDFGPGAGRLGGQIVARGTPEQVAKQRGSVTGPYLSGKKAIRGADESADAAMQSAEAGMTKHESERRKQQHRFAAFRIPHSAIASKSSAPATTT